MDDGRLTDGQGRTVDFTNTVLIMTSNLGGGGDESVVMAAVHQHFKPEFVNRIDELVVFHRLDERHIAEIVDIQVAQLRQAPRGAWPRPRAHRRGSCSTSRASGYDPDFGARPLKRVLQKEIADPIALSVLSGRVPRRRRDPRRCVADGLVFERYSNPVGAARDID